MRRIGDSKNGQQMTLGTIILMVLGVAVLVLLIFGFSTGWKNMWSKVTTYGSGTNVDAIRQTCAIACSSGDEYGFCTQARNTVLEDGSFNKTATCKHLTESVKFEKGSSSKPVSIEVTPCTISCQ